MHTRSLQIKGGVYFSIEDVCKFAGASKTKIRYLITIGVLTGYKKLDRTNDWKRTRKMYVLGDEYLESFFLAIGAVCTGMTYEQAKNYMTAIGNPIGTGYNRVSPLGNYLNRPWLLKTP